MPTCARRHQLEKSLIYHVYNRANGGQKIFRDKADCLYWKNLAGEYAAYYETKIYHWVIMGNHYHLGLEIPDPERLSSMMAGLGRAYTYYFHKRYQTFGYLWQGRFKMQAIESERYLSACGRYIERNPVRAGIVETAQDYEFSSARFYCLGAQDHLTTDDPLYKGFGNDLLGRRRKYCAYLRDHNAQEEELFRQFEEPLGNREFVNRLLMKMGHYIPRRRGRKKERIVL